MLYLKLSYIDRKTDRLANISVSISIKCLKKYNFYEGNLKTPSNNENNRTTQTCVLDIGIHLAQKVLRIVGVGSYQVMDVMREDHRLIVREVGDMLG